VVDPRKSEKQQFYWIFDKGHMTQYTNTRIIDPQKIMDWKTMEFLTLLVIVYSTEYN
jgi:hypothetical protein